MQTVTDRWYVIYTRAMFGIACLLMAACLASWFVPGANFLQRYGMSYVTLVLASASIVYFIAWRPRQIARNGIYAATFQMTLLEILTIINLMQSTGRLHSWYLILWFVMVMATGMLGSYALASVSCLMTLYFIIGATDVTGYTNHDPLSIGMVVLTWLVCCASFFIWKKHYINRESLQVGELNKLLKSKQLEAEALIQAIGDGVIVTDVDNKILLMNPAAASLVNWQLSDAIGIDVRTVMTLNGDEGEPLIADQNPFITILQSRVPANHTLNLVTKDGISRVISLVISPVLQQGNQELAAIVAVFRDVTGNRAEEKRRADFISTASHEMRTPVAAIEGYLALALNEHVSKIDTKARDYLEKAHASTQHLGQLFQDLLTSAKAEDGRLVNHPAVVEMGAYLEQISDSLKFAAQKKGLLTDFTIGAANISSNTGGNKVIRPLYYVLADPDRMREVITNLFDNSVKYTDSGRVSIGLTGNDKVVQFFIKDTGQGIPQEDIAHLFQKFYRVDNSSTRTIGGTGLGLFICRKIVELYNGRIWVDSEYQKGSTFFINLPRLTSTKAAELQALQASGQELTIPKA